MRRGTDPPLDHVAVRLDDATIARLDALLPLYAIPGRGPKRSDGLRAVILAGLEVEERRAVDAGRARWVQAGPAGPAARPRAPRSPR